MFPRISKTKKASGTYEYLVISESEWKNGQSITKNIANLGNVKKIGKEEIKGLIDGLIRLFEIKEYALKDQLDVLESLEHGSILLWRAQWNRLMLSEIIKKLLKRERNKIRIDAEKYIELMVINRCINPLSKLGVVRWYESTCYKRMKGYNNLPMEVEYFYRSMDYLLEIKEGIEKELFNKLRSLFSINVKMTFYDITSTFFYTENCEIGAKGYSRDMRGDKEQIVIGVVTSYEGYPIKHYVFEGNRKDESTVGDVIKELREEFNIEETTFVGDRGMISKLNLKKLEEENFDYIMGIKHRQDEIVQIIFDEGQLDKEAYIEWNGLKIWDKNISVKRFLFWKIKNILHLEDIEWSEGKYQKLQIGLEELIKEEGVNYIKVKELVCGLFKSINLKAVRKIFNLLKKYEKKYNGTNRIVICLNEVRKKLSKEKRRIKLNNIEKELKKLFSKKIKDKEKIDRDISRIFEGYKKQYKKFFRFYKNEDGIAENYKLDKKMILSEEKRDGIFILTTNHEQKALPAKKVVESYKNLREVEELFDDLKNFVDIHPVRHWLVPRVKSHVFLCLLALLLKRIFEINCLQSKAATIPLEEIAKVKLVINKIKFSHKSDDYQIIPTVTNISEFPLASHRNLELYLNFLGRGVKKHPAAVHGERQASD